MSKVPKSQFIHNLTWVAKLFIRTVVVFDQFGWETNQDC